jgi:hypothetical protein
MKKIIAVAMAAIGLLGTGAESLAESNAPEAHALSVQIEANDDELDNLVNSYISRQLRSLKDVTVNTASQPTFVIHCVCMPALAGERNIGCIVNLVITSNVKPLENIVGNKDIAQVMDNSSYAKVYVLNPDVSTDTTI